MTGDKANSVGDSEFPAPRHRFRLRDLPAMVAAGIGLHHAYVKMADDDDAYPRAAMLTDHSKLICDRAVELAKGGREDLDAVRDLARLARGKTRDLKAAARSLRMSASIRKIRSPTAPIGSS